MSPSVLQYDAERAEQTLSLRAQLAASRAEVQVLEQQVALYREAYDEIRTPMFGISAQLLQTAARLPQAHLLPTVELASEVLRVLVRVGGCGR